MDTKVNDGSIDPNELPEENFKRKEIFQHPQPADQGLPLDKDSSRNNHPSTTGKDQEKTEKEEGLNQEKSKGDAGAFEGFENHGH